MKQLVDQVIEQKSMLKILDILDVLSAIEKKGTQTQNKNNNNTVETRFIC